MLKFSIITICYNDKENLKKTIESVYRQSYKYFEYLIIDGASIDGTTDILQEYKKAKNIYIESEKDLGIYNAMNKGIAKITGDYVIFLNAGDVFYSDDVLTLLSDYLADGKADIVVGNYIEKKHETSKLISMNMDVDWKDHLQKGWGICHQAIVSSIRCIEDGFDETYKIAADFDWLCRQINLGYKIQWADIIISEFDVYGVSSLAKNWTITKAECKTIVEKNFPYMKGRIEREIDEQYKIVKFQKYLECLSDMLALKQRKASIADFLTKQSIYSIGIYGFQYLGQRIMDELEGTEIFVRYIIDRDHSFRNVKKPLKYISDILDPVDAIVVTPIFEFYNIKRILEEKFKGKIISIEDIINGMY